MMMFSWWWWWWWTSLLCVQMLLLYRYYCGCCMRLLCDLKNVSSSMKLLTIIGVERTRRLDVQLLFWYKRHTIFKWNIWNLLSYTLNILKSIWKYIFVTLSLYVHFHTSFHNFRLEKSKKSRPTNIQVTV